MRKIAAFLDPYDPAAMMFEGAARVYERLAAGETGSGDLAGLCTERSRPVDKNYGLTLRAAAQEDGGRGQGGYEGLRQSVSRCDVNELCSDLGR